MIRYILKRILLMIPVLLGVITIIFVLSVLTPGDPVEQIVGSDASPQVREAKREELGLNDPIVVQWGRYVWNLVTKGDFGTSYRTKQPVMTDIALRIPKTLELAAWSLLVALLVGLPLGILSAVYHNSWIDSLSVFASLIVQSVPQFWLGLMLIIVFSVRLGLLPSAGVWEAKGWILPVATCGLGSAAGIARMTRTSMLDVIRSDYIRTARAKGQKEYIVIWKHALKNAMIPIITNIGGCIGGLLGGAVTIETVFAVPGIGKYMVDSLSARDFPAVRGGVLFLAIVLSVVYLAVDIAYAFVDPRIMAKYKKGKGRKEKRMQSKEV